jgi:hypothetical protein
MTGHTARHAATVVISPLVLVLWLMCGAAAPAAGGPAQGTQELSTAHAGLVPSARVRGADAKARLLLQEGDARSATFRTLLEALAPSDLIVYVETGAFDRPGQLLFVTAGPDYRFLRISIRVPGRDADLIAWLAHELQHAVEIAAAREVRDGHAVLGLYQRIGLADRSTGESVAAQQAWARVRDEVLFGRWCARTAQRR